MNGMIERRREDAMPEIRRSRAELRESLEDLQATIQSRIDVRKRIVEHPTSWLIGGLLLGMVLGNSNGRKS